MPPTKPRHAGVHAPTPLPCETSLSQAVDSAHPSAFRLAIAFPSPISCRTTALVRVGLEPVAPTHDFLDIDRAPPPEPVSIRLSVPAALVAPEEIRLQPSISARAEAEFRVTPLIPGHLPCRAEVQRGDTSTSIDVELRSQGVALPWLIAILTLLGPVILHGLAQNGARLPGWVQQQTLAWLPQQTWSEPASRQFAHLVDKAVALIREYRLSFYVFVALAVATLGVLLLRWPRSICRWSEPFLLASSAGPKPQNPLSNFLTPVSLPDVNPFSSSGHGAK